MASVLLVGMRGMAQGTAQDALVAAGCTVARAETGEFLHCVRERPVDAVVIDVSPMQHGAHIVGIAELRVRHPRLPIVAVCGGPDASVLLDIAAAAGADRTLPKPFTREAIRRTVAGCLAAASGTTGT